MKKALLIGVLAALPLLAPLVTHAADVSIGISAPGVSIQIGDRDNRGYYWYDGRYRDPSWWNAHPQYHPKYGYRNPRGYYWAGDRWRDESWWKKNGKKHGKKYDRDDDDRYHCPPGQAKKGNC